MNFLAHIYLSGEKEEIKIGNFIADRVRGKQYLEYEPQIRKGILLHREIDTYTDFHPIFRRSKKKFVPVYNHYSGVITDVVYDHFLAKNWHRYASTPLEEYARDFYSLLYRNLTQLPEAIQRMYPIMVAENWLVTYKSVDGITRILTQMDRRTQNQSLMRFASKELVENYEVLETEFIRFFEEIQTHLKSNSFLA